MCVCLEPGWSPLSENEKNFLNPAHCLSYFHHSGSTLSSLFTAECTIMTYFASIFKSERILPNIRMFWFSVQNTSSCLLTVSQTTKAPIYSAVPLNHRAVCRLQHISAHCVYSANYAWRLCTQSTVVDSPRRESVPWAWLLEMQRVCLDHGFITLPIPCSHLHVTSDEQSCCSLLETLHGSLAP